MTPETVGKSSSTVGKSDLTVGKTAGKKFEMSTNEKILSLLRINPQTTRDELARALCLSIRGIEYAIGTLKKAGRLRKVGGKRFGYWEVIHIAQSLECHV